MRYEWKCPKCGIGADPNASDCQNLKKLCTDRHTPCQGLICECWELGDGAPGDDVSTDSQHGEIFANPCHNAVCYHCGWAGKLPVRPKKLPKWAKTALDNGWSPPDGWTP